MAEDRDKNIVAEEAGYLLNHPLLITVFAEIREDLVQEVEYGDATNEAANNKVMLSLQLLRGIRERLESKVEDAILTSNTEE